MLFGKIFQKTRTDCHGNRCSVWQTTDVKSALRVVNEAKASSTAEPDRSFKLQMARKAKSDKTVYAFAMPKNTVRNRSLHSDFRLILELRDVLAIGAQFLISIPTQKAF